MKGINLLIAICRIKAECLQCKKFAASGIITNLFRRERIRRSGSIHQLTTNSLILRSAEASFGRQ
jgi:hypothetical protein